MLQSDAKKKCSGFKRQQDAIQFQSVAVGVNNEDADSLSEFDIDRQARLQTGVELASQSTINYAKAILYHGYEREARPRAGTLADPTQWLLAADDYSERSRICERQSEIYEKVAKCTLDQVPGSLASTVERGSHTSTVGTGYSLPAPTIG